MPLDHLAVDCPVLQYSNMLQYIIISLAANVQTHELYNLDLQP